MLVTSVTTASNFTTAARIEEYFFCDFLTGDLLLRWSLLFVRTRFVLRRLGLDRVLFELFVSEVVLRVRRCRVLLFLGFRVITKIQYIHCARTERGYGFKILSLIVTLF